MTTLKQIKHQQASFNKSPSKFFDDVFSSFLGIIDGTFDTLTKVDGKDLNVMLEFILSSKHRGTPEGEACYQEAFERLKRMTSGGA